MAALSAAVLALGSCMIRFNGLNHMLLRGEGPCVDSTLTVESFSGLCVVGNLEAEFIQSPDRFAVEATLPRNLMDSLQAISNGVNLTLSFGENNVIWKPEYKIRVYGPGLSLGVVEGSGGLRIEALDEPAGVFRVTGSGDLFLRNARVPYLSLTLSGSGDIHVSDPRTQSLQMKMAGSGDIGVHGMTADSVRVSLAGSGDVFLGGEVSCWADLSVAGSGDINARNLTCPDFRTRVAGSGDILRP